MIADLLQQTDKGESIVIRCRMGIGRSSIIAAAILLRHGYTTEELIRRISAARNLSVPDTESQIRWLKEQENKLTPPQNT